MPPEPPKLLAMAEQVVAFDEDLPPIDLVLDAVDLRQLAAAHPARRYLLPCRGSGVDLAGEVAFLDTRPARAGGLDARSAASVRCSCTGTSTATSRRGSTSAPGSECGRPGSSEPTLAKCCLLERGIEFEGGTAVVPWGSNLDEIRRALRWLTGVDTRDEAAVG